MSALLKTLGRALLVLWAALHPAMGGWSSGPYKIMRVVRVPRRTSHQTTKDCAPHAVEVVRRLGGVLEHPRGSKLFEAMGMPKPGGLPDRWGGVTYEIAQCDWGHVARKRIALEDIPPAPPPREPTHWVSGVHTPGARGKPPAGIKICSAEQRRRTPVAFAQWLVQIAATARPGLLPSKVQP